jgi:hypothetical protein
MPRERELTGARPASAVGGGRGALERIPGLIPGSPGAWRLFELGFRPWFRRQVAGIHVAGASSARITQDDIGPLPLILVANHTSWFDGFLLREVHRRVNPRSRLLSLMLQRELDANPILRWIGGCGFDPERPLTLRRALASINAQRKAGVTLSFFPQGRIYPSTRRPLGFARGIEGVLRILSPAIVLPVGLHLEMGNQVRPSAWINLGEMVRVGDGSQGSTSQEIEGEIHALLDLTHNHLSEHGEGAAAAWPPVSR